MLYPTLQFNAVQRGIVYSVCFYKKKYKIMLFNTHVYPVLVSFSFCLWPIEQQHVGEKKVWFEKAIFTPEIKGARASHRSLEAHDWRPLTWPMKLTQTKSTQKAPNLIESFYISKLTSHYRFCWPLWKYAPLPLKTPDYFSVCSLACLG